MKRNRIRSVTTVMLMLGQMAVALPSNANAVKKDVVGKVVGTVSFEHRFGILPATMQNTSYWSAVLHSEDADYELSHVFAMDQDTQPGSTTIQGAVVHPGEQVVVEGRIQKIRKDFGLMSEIKQIKLVNDENSAQGD